MKALFIALLMVASTMFQSTNAEAHKSDAAAIILGLGIAGAVIADRRYRYYDDYYPYYGRPYYSHHPSYYRPYREYRRSYNRYERRNERRHHHRH